MLARLGQLVSSRAGRDQGQYFLVIQILNDKQVAVANGRVRKVENPKIKSLRHLVFHPQVDKEMEKKILDKKPITNREVREALLKLGITE